MKQSKIVKSYVKDLKDSLKNTPDDAKMLIKTLEEITGVKKEDLK